MRMKQHRQILKEVLEIGEKEREQEITRMIPTLRSLIDDATFITGLADSAICIDSAVHSVYQSHYQYR